MRLTEQDIRHFKNVSWGIRFWSWFRWVFAGLLLVGTVGQLLGFRVAKSDWLIAGVVYLMVAWPGLCRSYVFHTLQRFVAADPEASQQLEDAGVRNSVSFNSKHGR